MSNKTDEFLAKGLKSGFGGGNVMQNVKRSGFNLDSSHFEDKKGRYHDEWAAARAGGGQELVWVEGKNYTRVYAGGTINPIALDKLGIKIDDVMVFLKKIILNNASLIRLHQNFGPIQEKDWSYSYTVIERNEQIPLTTGKEEILYKGKLVFQHNFLICPVD